MFHRHERREGWTKEREMGKGLCVIKGENFFFWKFPQQAAAYAKLPVGRSNKNNQN